MSQQKFIVTGVNGFVGKHLVSELVSSNIAVIGVDRSIKADEEIKALLFQYHSADLAEAWPQIGDNIEGVIHLAGLAAVGPSFENPQQYINVNSAILTNLAECYLTQKHKPRIVIVSSGGIYDADQPMPLTESSSIGFNSPYAVSKILTENQCAYYRNRGLDCVVVRPFNHIGPGQKLGFLVPDLYEQLLNFKLTGQSLLVGNLKTKRDYTDVRDVVRAYRLLATAPKLSSVVYNVCSGGSVSGENILSNLIELTGTSGINLEVDKSRVRPTDPPDIYGSYDKLKADTGWQPEISLKQTLKDFVDSLSS